MPTRKVVPFGRQLGVGSRGNDVKAVQRALTRAGFGGKLSRAFGVFGVGTRTRVKKAQKAYGLPATGVYGLATHARLVAAFADYEIFLYTGHNPHESAEDRTRRLIVAAALALYAVADQIFYTQGPQRMSIVRRRLRPPFIGAGSIYEDCSSLVTGCYWIGGGPDPNGRFFNLLGYTGDMADHGRSVTLAQAKICDVVLYKSPSYPTRPWAHAAIYIGGGRVVSFGSRPIRILPIDYRTGAYGRVDIRNYF